jgi:hypothetical protein
MFHTQKNPACCFIKGQPQGIVPTFISRTQVK